MILSRRSKFSAAGNLASPFRVMAALLALVQPLGSGIQAASAPMQPSLAAHLQKVSYDNRQIRIELDKEAAYKVFSMEKPARIVVELYDTIHSDVPFETSIKDSLLKRIRSAQFKTAPDRITRVVLDMASLPAYETLKEGSQIILQLKGGEEAAEAKEESLSGEKSASVTATASGSGGTLKRGKGKDLLAALPRQAVTIDFENADIRDVIGVLSDMSGINMIYDADVSGFLTVHLDQVPFNQAFDTILTIKGLVAQQMGDNILRILTPASLSADRSRAVTVYKTFTLNYAKASEVQTHLASVRISPTGKITVDERTNSLVVTDTPEGLASAERLIADLDQKPQQVLIEAKLVEVKLTDSLNVGVTWEYAGRHIVNDTLRVNGIRQVQTGTEVPEGGGPGFLGVRPTVADPTTLEEFVQNAAGPTIRGTGVALPGRDASAITFGLINNTDLLTVTLNALADKGLSKVLSTPKVITVNNKQAKIQSGSRIPFFTNTVSPSGTTQSVTFVDAGILLTVTPTINADDRIRLNIKPEVSIPQPAPSGAPPTVDTRNADTEVLIRDGETIVIGGLIDEKTSDLITKVPLLGDIPVLGTFFRSQANKKDRTELLIFVTPRIIRD